MSPGILKYRMKYDIDDPESLIGNLYHILTEEEWENFCEGNANELASSITQIRSIGINSVDLRYADNRYGTGTISIGGDESDVAISTPKLFNAILKHHKK